MYEDKVVLHSLIWKCYIPRYCKSKMKNKLNKPSAVFIVKQSLFSHNFPVSSVVFKLKFNVCFLTLQLHVCRKRFLNLIKFDKKLVLLIVINSL